MKMQSNHSGYQALSLAKSVPMAKDLTKREHFAGLAMQGILTTNDYRPDETAVIAVKVADALIEALNKETE